MWSVAALKKNRKKRNRNKKNKGNGRRRRIGGRRRRRRRRRRQDGGWMGFRAALRSVVKKTFMLLSRMEPDRPIQFWGWSL
jgi:hypothetical protein